MAVLIFLALGQLVRSITPSFYKGVGEMMRTADGLAEGGLLNGRTAAHYYLDTIKSEKVLFGADFSAALSRSVGVQLISEVSRLDGSSSAEGRSLHSSRE